MEDINLIIDYIGIGLYWAVKIFAVTSVSYFLLFALFNQDRWSLLQRVAKIGAYPFAILNFVNNAYCMTIWCLDWPREGATTLRMARYIYKYGGKTNAELNRRERWRLGTALFLCRLAGMADPEHCERQVRKMKREDRG